MRAALIAITVVFASTLASGCRSCADRAEGAAADAGAPQPAMPSGMLVPVQPAADAQAEGANPRVARHVKSGAWTELQIARPGDTPARTDFEHWRDDSLFVSLDAMTLMHEPFARALPGFDLFLPRLYDPEALAKLASELEAFARTSSGPIAVTAREVAKLAQDAAGKHQSLWVLGV